MFLPLCRRAVLPAVLLAGGFFTLPAAAQITARVSVNSAGGQVADPSWVGAISADGRTVAFQSSSDDLVPGDTNGQEDIFVHDRLTGRTRRVSVDSAGTQANYISRSPSISSNGRFVTFSSEATNLVAGDTNHAADVFVHDCQTGQTGRVSVDSAGAQANGSSLQPMVSANGRYVAFHSFASNLVPGDTNGAADGFVHDRLTGVTSMVSVSSAGVQGNSLSAALAISADGRFVTMTSDANNLVPGDTNIWSDIFVHDRQTGQTSRVSVDSSGLQCNGGCESPTISADGRIISFLSSARNLVPGDTNGLADVFVHDRLTGQTIRVNVDSFGAQSNSLTESHAISADGFQCAFVSAAANLVPGDTNNTYDVFVHDMRNQLTSRVSVNSAGMQSNGRNGEWSVAISADGGAIAFGSAASNLIASDTNGVTDAFVFDRNAAGPNLARTGVCPGPITLTITGATAGGPIALVHGPAGVFVKPNLPCLGLTLGVSPPTLATILTADGLGIAVFNFSAPVGACGLSVQAVDGTTCLATNVIVL